LLGHETLLEGLNRTGAIMNLAMVGRSSAKAGTPLLNIAAHSVCNRLLRRAKARFNAGASSGGDSRACAKLAWSAIDKRTPSAPFLIRNLEMMCHMPALTGSRESSRMEDLSPSSHQVNPARQAGPLACTHAFHEGPLHAALEHEKAT
jgi:hypothetical protein